jgi:hypothetical protein
MSNFSASIPVANMQSANTTLEQAGFGPNNFSVPSYAVGPTPSYGLLHCWNNPEFEAAVAAIPGVVIQQGLADPIATTSALVGEWSADAKPLIGTVTPGLYRDAAQVLWWVIQSYNTAVYPDPLLIPALIRLAKVPGEMLPWIQPLDQFDSYQVLNPFTGEGDLSTHNGSDWQVTQGNGAGLNNWEPGVFGWTVINVPAPPPPLDYVTYNGDPVFYNGEGVTYG